MAKRDEKGQFKAGESGNPGGRPQGLAGLVRACVGDEAEELIIFVLEVLRDKEASLKTRMDAATWLADRGWGKPAQSMKHTGAADGPIEIKLSFDPGEGG